MKITIIKAITLSTLNTNAGSLERVDQKGGVGNALYNVPAADWILYSQARKKSPITVLLVELLELVLSSSLFQYSPVA
jgi:hypothetical protein